MKKTLALVLAVMLMLTSALTATTAFAEPETKTYTVTWENYDHSILERDLNVAEGSKPEYNSATPIRAIDGSYYYEFSGWTPAITDETKVTDDVTYTAQFTAHVYYKGTLSTGLTWTLTPDTGVLSVEGTGKIPDFNEITLPDKSKQTDAPWYAHASNVKSLVIGNKVTSVGKNAFAYLPALERVEFPVSVTYSDKQAFKDSEIKYVNYSGTVNDWAMIEFEMKSSNPAYCATDLHIGGKLLESANITSKYARQYTFCKLLSLKQVTFGTAVEKIGKEAFRASSAIESVVIPINVINIKAEAFNGCTGLKNATVKYGKCEIGDSKDTADEIKYIFPESTVLHSCPNTTLQAYATKYSRTFVADEHKCTVTSNPAGLFKNGAYVSKCSECGNDVTNTTINMITAVNVTSTTQYYTGKAKSVKVSVKDSTGKTLAEGSDYTIIYDDSRIDVGSHAGTVKFINNYSGEVRFTYTISPKATKISKLTAKSKGFYVKWAKRTVQSDGYQIQYATNKAFSSGKKTVTIKNNKTKKTTIKKLTGNKKYYVRVRTYRTAGGKKYYSKWTAVSNVKTKK